MMRKFFVFAGLLLFSYGGFSQQEINDFPPLVKGYEGSEGKVIKKHLFNFIKLKDESGEKERQATGRYWEMSYSYDSIFRQKRMFASFLHDEIKRNNGMTFFADTTEIHFAIARDSMPNLWGKAVLKSDRVYKLEIIEEIPFENFVQFDSEQRVQYEEFVDTVALPPRLGFIPNTVITGAKFSKFNHFRITFVKDKRSYGQSLMGPYWDLKMKVVDANGETDTRVSSVQIMESYYRAVIKAKGTILKSKQRELIFNVPVENDKKLWVRVVTSLDGLYYMRMVLQDNKDETDPVSALDKKAEI